MTQPLAFHSSSTPDWFTVPWADVWARYGWRPEEVVGVLAPKHGAHVAPFPRLVHRSHLPLFDLRAPVQGTKAQFDILRPHQKVAVEYITSRRGTLLADAMRVGKTCSTMYAHDPDSGLLLVIGPLASRSVWHEWAARRWGHCGEQNCVVCARVGAVRFLGRPSFVSLTGRKIDPVAFAGQPHVVFLHFAILPSWSLLFGALRIGTLVVDECHQAGVANRKSVTFEGVRKLNTVAARCVCLSGTPMLSKPSGLWPILDLVAPGAFGSFWPFAQRWAGAQPGPYGWRAEGATNLDELRLRLSEVMLRRTWADVQGALPTMTRSIETVAVPEARVNELREIVAQLNHESGNQKTLVGSWARLRKLFAAEKVKYAVASLLSSVVDGHAAIGWTWHRDVAEDLARALRAKTDTQVFGPIHGGLSAMEREDILAQARDAHGPRILVATMATLATAVDLSYCDHQVFVELDWTPANVAQAEMRPYNGQHPVSTVYLAADCDLEQALANALVTKLDASTALGLGSGIGDVSDVLRGVLGVEDKRTLDMLASAIFSSEEET